ncbi:hypothetical protein [Acinetobacter variabilis]|uniref:Uncharacterized protein n=1 Tax=Acinetobacter variabilis TaxID=70346 RepID=A0A7T7WKT2_9GAMM|nr:hypothetical protein [Acinetobacter variabilis]QQN89093.1 hypothetical protein IAQ69_05370 [Acinetobacter variabilis]
MSKNWRFEGFVFEDAFDKEQLLNTSIDQGNFLIKISEKIKNQESLTNLEADFAYAVLQGVGNDFINNAEKKVNFNMRAGRPANLYRYEMLLYYYHSLKILKVQAKARFLVANNYLFTITSDDTDEEKIKKLEDNLRTWIREDSVDKHVKKIADACELKNSEAILHAYEKLKKQWKN